MERLRQFRTDLAKFMATEKVGPVKVRIMNHRDLVESEKCSEVKLELSTEKRREVGVVIITSPDDYPDGTAIIIDDGPREILTANLQQAFQFVCGVLTGGRVPASSQMSPAPDADSEEDDTGTGWRDAGSGTDEAMSSDEDWDSVADNGPDGFQAQWAEARAAIPSHMFLKAEHGLDLCEVGFLLAVEGLSDATRQAWTLGAGASLKVRFFDVHSANFRAAGRQPKVRISLEGDENRVFAVGKQLEKISDKWLSENWRVTDDKERDGGNVFIRIYEYLCRRLQGLNDYCIICDEKHVFSMPLPSVCNGALCSFAYETLGLMSDVALVATQLEIMDLLLVFFRAAVASPRVHLLLDPWPAVPDPAAPGTLVINPETKDQAAIAAVLDKLPCPSHLRLGGWTEALKAAHAVAFPLVRWVMSTNRTFLCVLEEERQLAFMRTPHQFLMISDSQAKEAAFLKAKAQFGRTVFAFHGSPIGNWHSILRKGLINASDTNLMAHGKALGNGIYLSTVSSTSFGYSARSTASPVPQCQLPPEERTSHRCTEGSRFIWDTRCICLALCEVVDSPSLVKHNSTWVLMEPTHCATRFLCVFAGQSQADPQVDVATDNIRAQIEAALRARQRHIGD